MTQAPLDEEKACCQPTYLGKRGIMLSVLTESHGMPLSGAVDGANRHDLTLTRITSEGQVTKRPELTAERPQGIYLDQGYNYDEVRDLLCEFGLTTPIRKHGEAAKERREDASRKSHRWVVERTLRGRNMFNRIVVICVGNICRSPMAEALLGRQLSAYPQMSVTSAGIGALVGYPADETAQALLLKQGIDISTHRARQLNSATLRQADLVLVMEAEHKRAIDMIDPSVRGKIYRLGEWGGFDISDPYRQPREAFEECLRLIQRGVADWSAKLIL